MISKDEIRATVAAQLDCAPADVADHDDLIQLGLNSIRMMALAGGWRKRGADITFAQLAANPTVDSWHDLLMEGMAGAAQPVPNQPVASEDAPSRWQPCSTRIGSDVPTSSNSAG